MAYIGVPPDVIHDQILTIFPIYFKYRHFFKIPESFPFFKPMSINRLRQNAFPTAFMTIKELQTLQYEAYFEIY